MLSKYHYYCLLCLAASLIANPLIAGAACLDYEPAVVSVSGKVEVRDYPGPPNYESIAAGDKKETSWILKLDKPVCVHAGKDAVAERENNVAEMQLALDAEKYDKYRSLLSSPVSVTGTLFHSHTGHHHTKVLLTVGEIKSNKKKGHHAETSELKQIVYLTGCKDEEIVSDIVASIEGVTDYIRKNHIQVQKENDGRECGYRLIYKRKDKFITSAMTDIDLIEEAERFFSR